MNFNKNKLDYLFSILEKQVDSLGRYNYKGNFEKDINFKFLLEESGDMTYHIGILLQILAFSYNFPEYKFISGEILYLILNVYLEKVFVNGFYGREILYKEEYERILPHQKHCTKGTFLGLDSGICNKWTEKNGFMIRYDISLDAISSLLAGFYFVYKNIPLYRRKIYEITYNMYKYYQKNNFFVKDIETGKPCRFGNHHPTFIPLGYLSNQMISILIGHPIKRNIIMEFILNNIRTYVTGLYKDKKDRFTYNGYMFMMILNALQDYIEDNNIKYIDYKCAIRNILKEAKGEQNLFFLKIANRFNLDYDPGLVSYDLDYYIVEGMSSSFKFNFVVDLKYRSVYNRWEKSAYMKTEKVSDLYYCNEDLLQAYFMYNKI
ncbi:MAG: hypothetical protein KatS3mg068_1558 [Candidatus Sericytochromatia bacterium]|nr:MAG: hypothetical protein KatS3mg068_1558 [Candidatus Sericytochromatia bacterium]